ncbi:hypothetical protein DM860_006204 [Cuscuta australis]|uniref:Pre-rRNA-processing protein TSR2 homolog n=1 Tax=Cuscuta australis TaxID=267555 RepID=A0A328DLA6_9ASTE|nr:hypothetical protein DM860_006204 [Cuscuta australis]
MDFENHPPLQLTAVAAAQFQEGIFLVLSRWTSLQMAVTEEWGGPTSRKKSEDLAVRIFSLFAQSKVTLYADDLEDFLDDFMISDFSAELDDGSIEEVAEKLMVMHGECAEGNFKSINDLKATNLENSSVSYKRQEVRGEGDDDSDSDSVVDGESDLLGNESSGMAVDSFEHQTCMDQREMMIDEPSTDITTEDGWTVVSSRKRNGRKN